MALSGELRHPYVIAYSLEGLADLAGAEAYPGVSFAWPELLQLYVRRAAQKLQRPYRRGTQTPWSARQMLGEQARASAWAAGQALTLEQAIAEALSM